MGEASPSLCHRLFERVSPRARTATAWSRATRSLRGRCFTLPAAHQRTSFAIVRGGRALRPCDRRGSGQYARSIAPRRRALRWCREAQQGQHRGRAEDDHAVRGHRPDRYAPSGLPHPSSSSREHASPCSPRPRRTPAVPGSISASFESWQRRPRAFVEDVNARTDDERDVVGMHHRGRVMEGRPRRPRDGRSPPEPHARGRGRARSFWHGHR